MSNRAMSRMYSAGGGYSGGGDDSGGLLDLIANLTGGNDITGGFSVDPNTQQISATPFQAKGGFMSGKAKMRANMLNAQTLGPAFAEQAGHRAMGEQQRETDKQKAITDLLKAHGLSPNKNNQAWLDQQLGPLLQEASIQEAKNKGAALDPNKNANIQANTDIGANIAAAGINPALLNGTAGPGTISKILALPGVGGETLAGSRKKTTTTTVGQFPMKQADGSTIMVGGHPSISEEDTPQIENKPLNPDIKNAILSGGNAPVSSQMQAMPAMPGLTQDNVGLGQDDRDPSIGQVTAQPAFGGATGLIPQGLGMLKKQAPNIMQGLKQGMMQNYTGMNPQMQQYLYQLLWSGQQQQGQTNQAQPQDQLNPSAQYTKDLMDKINQQQP